MRKQGGRCLDGAPPAILTLLEIHKRFPEVFREMEVYLDGGKRSQDIVQALNLSRNPPRHRHPQGSLPRRARRRPGAAIPLLACVRRGRTRAPSRQYDPFFSPDSKR
jgi:hypothetical protein